ncbi:MAG: hypothetical protein IPP57_19200 [Candidatus Obscuribacter sp.]|nr:hypothetical protein [Candidatus Obscuribacter sp.]
MQSFNSSRNFSPVRDFNATDFGIGERKPLITSQSGVKKSDMSTIALDAARRIREIQRAKEEALEAVSENEISREIQTIKRELETNRTHTLMMRLDAAKAKLKTDKPASYTKAIKLSLTLCRDRRASSQICQRSRRDKSPGNNGCDPGRSDDGPLASLLQSGQRPSRNSS